MSAEGLSTSFSNYTKSLEDEVKMLKSLVTLRSVAPGSESAESIFVLEESLVRLEESFDVFESHLDEEHQSLKKMAQMLDICKGHTSRLEAIESHLNSVNANRYSASIISAPLTRIGNNQQQNIIVQEKCELTDVEFDKIPKSTRLRLTLAQTNGMYRLLQDMVAKKAKMFKVPREKMNAIVLNKYDDFLVKKLPEHGDKIYLTESEIRSSTVFESGEATGRALLQTLRAVQRLRVFRSAGENTYVVL